jgi:hypothetical protein
VNPHPLGQENRLGHQGVDGELVGCGHAYSLPETDSVLVTSLFPVAFRSNTQLAR